MNLNVRNKIFLPSACVVQGKVMFWHVSVHPSVCPHLGRGGTPAKSRQGGTPARSSRGWGGGVRYPTSGTPIGPGQGGLPLPGGTPPWVPLSDLAGGYPTSGTPPSDLAGGTPPQVPPIRPGWGYPCQAAPHLRYPPLDLARWVPTLGGVLDTPRSVCLLRSCRRTFLFHHDFVQGAQIHKCLRQINKFEWTHMNLKATSGALASKIWTYAHEPTEIIVTTSVRRLREGNVFSCVSVCSQEQGVSIPWCIASWN